MNRSGFLLCCIVACAAGLAAAQDTTVVFRSDVALVRVDTQVTDRNNRAITGLTAEDFVLREGGSVQEIRNFASEDMPVDILMLLDVSGSMRLHVESVATASREALRALGPRDRVAIMVFDRATRLRMPFEANRTQITRGLENVLDQESFNGGTDITRAFYDAARYVAREGRRDARRAIVILTDDETEFNRDDVRVSQAMNGSGIVVSALLAPDALGTGSRGGRGTTRRGGGGVPGSWPGGGGLGDIIFGRRGPLGGGNGPVVIGGRGQTRSAGTADVARNTGGDSMRVDDAYALQTTFERIRQRYALHFNLGHANSGQENIDVQLSAAARRRFPDAEVRFRRVSMSGDVSGDSDAPMVASTTPVPTADPQDAESEEEPRFRRRPAVNDRSGGAGPRIMGRDESAAPPSQAEKKGGWRKSDEPEPAAAPEDDPKEDPPAKSGGWRKLKPGEKP